MQTTLVCRLSALFIIVDYLAFVESVTFGWRKAKLGHFPSTAALLRIDNDELIGGATIINSIFVIAVIFTFEYCLEMKVRVVAGDINHYRNSTFGTRQERIALYYYRPSRPLTKYNSLILFRLNKPFRITKWVKSLPIAGNKIVKYGTKVKIAGWSRPLYSNICSNKYFTKYLKYINVEIASRRTCPFDTSNQKGLFVFYYCFRGLESNRLSATGMLDIGSPAYMGNRILGIVSPMQPDWNFVDGRRIEILRPYQEWISKILSWDFMNPHPDQHSIYDENESEAEEGGYVDLYFHFTPAKKPAFTHGLMCKLPLRDFL